MGTGYVLCAKCSPFCNCAMGTASECGHRTGEQGYKWCKACAKTRNVCQVCGDAIPAKKDKRRRKRR